LRKEKSPQIATASKSPSVITRAIRSAS
jgi:hypothetical protein